MSRAARARAISWVAPCRLAAATRTRGVPVVMTSSVCTAVPPVARSCTACPGRLDRRPLFGPPAEPAAVEEVHHQQVHEGGEGRQGDRGERAGGDALRGDVLAPQRWG